MCGEASGELVNVLVMTFAANSANYIYIKDTLSVLCS